MSAQKSPGARQTGCELIASLMKRQQTRHELMQSTGVTENAVDKWLREMRQSGIVYRRYDSRYAGTGAHPVVYCLQSTPFEKGDEL